MRVSVIIPTYRRSHVLFDTVQSIMKDDYPDYEVIVVDQTEDHPESIIEFLNDMSRCSNFIYVKISIPNLPLARNVGMRISSGDILIYIDDDVIVEKGFIFAHVKRYTDPSVGAVVGRIVERFPPEENIKQLPGRIRPDGLAIGFFDRVDYSGEVETGQGCNMSFRRIALEEIGGFDERFTTFREEGDAFVRIRKLGWRAVFEPGAKLMHKQESIGGTRSNRDILYAKIEGFKQNSLFYFKNFGWIAWFRFFLYQLRTMYAAIRIHNWPLIRTFFKMTKGIFDGILTYFLEDPKKFSRKVIVEYVINIDPLWSIGKTKEKMR